MNLRKQTISISVISLVACFAFGSVAFGRDFIIRNATTSSPYFMAQGTTGYIGIGTIYPSSTLHVIGTATFGSTVTVGTPISNGDAATKSYVDTVAAGGTIWTRSGAYVYTTTSTDNVGIGTASPQTTLHAYSTIAGSGTERTTPLNVLTLEAQNTSDMEYNGFGQAIVFRGATYNNGTVRTLGRIVHTISDDSGNTTRGTAIRFETSDNAATTTAPTEKMRIDYNGYVGIGTTSPGSKLVVENAWGSQGTPMVNLNNTADGDTLYVKNTSTRSDMYIANFLNSSGSVMAIRASGNVGIGTTSPTAAKLVFGGSPTIAIDVNTGRIQNLGAPINPTDAATRNYVDSAIASVTSTLSTITGAFIQNGNSFATTATLGTNDTYPLGLEVGGTTRLTVATSGYVGIGIATPSERLEVSGRGRFNSGASFSAIDTGWASAHGYSTGNWGIRLGATGGAGVIQVAQSTTAYPLSLQLYGGNVGIGTASPGYKLTIVTSTVAIDVQSGRIQNLGAPINPTDAATRSYVDTVAAGGTIWTRSGSNVYVTTSTDSVGIGTASPGQKLDVSGNIRSSASLLQGTLVSRPYATWSVGSASTGAVIIKLPGTVANYGMVHMEINVYEYGGNSATTYICGGHNWNSLWYNYSCNTIGVADKKIRLAVKDNQYAVVIGEASSTWSYGHVVLSKITNGGYYSGSMDLGGTYSITQSSSTESFTWVSADLNRFNARTGYFAGDVGIGTTPATYKLNVGGTGGFSGTVVVATPTITTHATTKAYVDTLHNQQPYKPNVGTTEGTQYYFPFWSNTSSSLSATSPIYYASTTGNIGIGTTDPGSFRLNVQGGNLRHTGAMIAAGAGTTSAITGINYHAGASTSYDLMKLENNSSTALIVKGTTGNVGIGTASPNAKLEVSGDIKIGSASPWQLTKSAAKTFDIIAVNEGSAGHTLRLGLGGWSGDNFEIFTNSAFNTTVARLASNSNSWLNANGGNVGIGTSTPNAAKLVFGGSPTIAIDANTGRIQNLGAPVNDTDAATRNYVDSAIASVTSTLGTITGAFVQNGNSFAGTATLGTNDAYPLGLEVGGTTYLTVATSGYIGIGVTVPGKPLDVRAAQSEINLLSTTGTNRSGILMDNTGAGVTFIGTENSAGGSILGGSIPYAGVLGTTGALPLQFGTNNAVNMTILSGGNIGIGNPSPSSTLHVSGGIRATTASQFDSTVIVGTPSLDTHATPRSYVNTVIQWLPGAGYIYQKAPSDNVSIGSSTAASYKLHVFGSLGVTGTSNLLGGANLNGQNITGVNKITVTTIDPVYRIGGVNYATYAGSFAGGVKEEYSGRAKLVRSNDKAQMSKSKKIDIENSDLELGGADGYEYVIDFNKLAIGSDLWLWFKAVDFGKENIEAVATPYGQSASIWYEIIGSSNSNSNSSRKIIFHGDKPAEFSFRLTGRRHDWREWPTKSSDQNERPSFIME